MGAAKTVRRAKDVSGRRETSRQAITREILDAGRARARMSVIGGAGIVAVSMEDYCGRNGRFTGGASE